jgi:hypothetical protein
MSDTTAYTFVPIPARPAPVRTGGLTGWMRANLFADWKTSAATAVIGGLLLWYLPQAPVPAGAWWPRSTA